MAEILFPFTEELICCPEVPLGCCETAGEWLKVFLEDGEIYSLRLDNEGVKDVIIPSSVFSVCGVYRISHIVSSCTETSIDEELVEIVDSPAQVSIRLSDDMCCVEGCYIVGQSITLFPQITTLPLENSARSYGWKVYFNCELILDTGVIGGPLPFTFQDIGKYKFVLEYRNHCGCLITDSITIAVNAPIRLNKVECFTWNITNCRKEGFNWELFGIGESGLNLIQSSTSTNFTVTNGIYLLRVSDNKKLYYFPVFEMCGILECLEELALCSDGCNLQIETIYTYLQSLISEYNAYSNEWNGEQYNYDLLYKISNLHTQLSESCKKCRQSSKCKK